MVGQRKRISAQEFVRGSSLGRGWFRTTLWFFGVGVSFLRRVRPLLVGGTVGALRGVLLVLDSCDRALRKALVSRLAVVLPDQGLGLTDGPVACASVPE